MLPIPECQAKAEATALALLPHPLPAPAPARPRPYCNIVQQPPVAKTAGQGSAREGADCTLSV